MNWVGGSRSRIMKSKEDSRKQREFFQKQRMQRKLHTSEPQSSPTRSNTGNVDLLTLFIVNQIASKKEHAGKPKINHLFGAKGTDTILKEPLELPMSPCSPSDLHLETSQPQYSVLKNKKDCLSEEFKFKPLSPVLESNLSDNSGSDNHHYILKTISPFSSASAGSLDPFSIQPRPTPNVSSCLQPWENPEHDCMKFVAFSQPMQLVDPWTAASNEAHILQSSPASAVQFRGTSPATDRRERSVMYPLSPLKSSEQQEELLFIDLGNRDCEENPHTEKSIKISLPKNTPSFRRVHDGSQNMDHDDQFLTKVSTCSDCEKCTISGNVPDCGSSGGGYLSSDDEDDDHCLQCASSSKQKHHPEDNPITNHCCSSLNNSVARPPQAPSSKQRVTSNCITFQRDETSDGVVSYGQTNKEDRSVPSQLQTTAQEHDENKKINLMTHDIGTQTAAVPLSAHRDVSVQCLLTDCHSSSISSPDYKNSIPTTRRHSFHFKELLVPATLSSPKNNKTEHNKTSMSSGGSVTKELAQRPPKSQIGLRFLKPHSRSSTKTPHLDHPFLKPSELKEQLSEKGVKIDKCEVGQLESAIPYPVKDARHTGKAVKENNTLTAERGANWVSEETETLQEIADILLMLKQRRKDQ